MKSYSKYSKVHTVDRSFLLKFHQKSRFFPVINFSASLLIGIFCFLAVNILFDTAFAIAMFITGFLTGYYWISRQFGWKQHEIHVEPGIGITASGKKFFYADIEKFTIQKFWLSHGRLTAQFSEKEIILTGIVREGLAKALKDEIFDAA